MPGSTAKLSLLVDCTGSVTEISEDMSGIDIARLTTRIRAGDEDAFREFHHLYFEPLYRFLLIVARGREDEAREALQETLLRVVRYIRKFENEEDFWCWLKAVARSTARDGGRKQNRYLNLLQRFTLHLERSTVEAPHELGALLEESLHELDPCDRQVIERKYLSGASVRELAIETGLTEKAIESRLLRLRRQLRQAVLRKLAL